MTYEKSIFAKLADNGVSGGTLVIGIDSRKWGRLRPASFVFSTTGSLKTHTAVFVQLGKAATVTMASAGAIVLSAVEVFRIQISSSAET